MSAGIRPLAYLGSRHLSGHQLTPDPIGLECSGIINNVTSRCPWAFPVSSQEPSEGIASQDSRWNRVLLHLRFKSGVLLGVLRCIMTKWLLAGFS